MIEKGFIGALGLSVLVLLAGIISAPLTGSNKSFELAPVLGFGRKFLGWIGNSAEDATKKQENPEPFIKIASRTAKLTGEAMQENLKNIPAGETDSRLSICPTGSIDAANRKEIPLSVAMALKNSSPSFNDLTEVQAMFKQNPACNWKDGSVTQWRYLVTGGRIVDARQSGSNQVVLKFTNFDGSEPAAKEKELETQPSEKEPKEQKDD